jgi:carboxylate-amine ligase
MDPAVCGCHVHVGVPDRELAMQVCTRLRAWLPAVQALTANSPIYGGADTGHASWRGVRLERWPSLGPTPEFESADDYDRVVEALVDAGVALDPTMAYWYARPSVACPTVEIRVGDVCSTAAEAVLIAGIIRALVATLLDETLAGVPATLVRDCLLSAAHWRAAHDGLDESLVDLRTGRKRPAWDLVDELLDKIMPALVRHGDGDLVTDQLATLRTVGNGAARQRELLSRDGIPSMLGTLADRTLLPWHSQDWSSTRR